MSSSVLALASEQATRQKCRTVVLIALASSWFFAGCGGKKNPSTLPPQTVTRVTPELEEPPPPLPPPVREIQPTRPQTVTVIDPGGSASGENSLLEASALAKAQKKNVPEPVADINDDNLREYAEGAEVIMLDSDPAAPDSEPIEPATTEIRSQDPRDESYWREGVLEIRMEWRRAVDMVKDLELESAALRQQFYAEEDTYLRDSQIKPAWDRVLDRIDELRERAVRSEQELNRLISDGMRAGVPQGWLNQGWELEPTEAEKAALRRLVVDDEIKAHQATEPSSVDP